MILKNSKRLKGTNISIREDLPVELRAKRREQLEEMKRLRSEGKFAIIKYDQLIVHGEDRRREEVVEDNVQSRSTGQKRALSQSPDVA
ncbi:Hypothetical predicted protein, partial [Olea europaea subsp. europaea]